MKRETVKRYVNIGNRKVGVGQSVFIIAEAGVNHNGSLKLAKKMIDSAKSVGVDAIKFQTFRTEALVTRNAPKADYQKKNSTGESQYEMLKKLELTEKEFEALREYCKIKKIIFLSTPFDFRSADFLYKLGIPAFKIGSGDLNNVLLLSHIAGYKRPIILSTGMATLGDVRKAANVIYLRGNKKIILLHCTSSYPVNYEEVNLNAMDTLGKTFGTPVGYSDHSKGIEVSIAAVAKGACVIEKHFTLDKTLPGPDHRVSLEPVELKTMVSSIRNVEKSLGNGLKIVQRSEIEIKKVARKSIVADCDIPMGTRLNFNMLALKRPGTGFEPEYLKKLIDKKARVDIKKDQVLTWKDLR